MAELLDGVNAGSFEQLGKLWAYAVDAEEVGMVRPAQNELLADARGLSQFLAYLGGSSFVKQLADLINSGSLQFLGVNLAYTFDVNNLVIHNPFGF